MINEREHYMRLGLVLIQKMDDIHKKILDKLDNTVNYANKTPPSNDISKPMQRPIKDLYWD